MVLDLFPRLVGAATALVLACAPSVSSACAALCSDAGNHRSGQHGSVIGAHPAAHGDMGADASGAEPATPVHHHVHGQVDAEGSHGLASSGPVGVAADAPLCCAHVGSAPGRSATSRAVAGMAPAAVAIASDAGLSGLAAMRTGLRPRRTSASPPARCPLVTLRI